MLPGSMLPHADPSSRSHTGHELPGRTAAGRRWHRTGHELTGRPPPGGDGGEEGEGGAVERGSEQEAGDLRRRTRWTAAAASRRTGSFSIARLLSSLLLPLPGLLFQRNVIIRSAWRPTATLEHHPAFPTLRPSGAAPSEICRLLTRGFINPGVAKKKAHQRCCNTPSRRRPSTTTTTTDDRRRRHPPPFFFSFSSDRSLPCAICPLRSHIPRSRHPRRRASPPR